MVLLGKNIQCSFNLKTICCIYVDRLLLYTTYIRTVELQLPNSFASFLASQRMFGFSMGSIQNCSSVVLRLRPKTLLLFRGSSPPRSMSEKRSLNSTFLHVKKSLKFFQSGMFFWVQRKMLCYSKFIHAANMPSLRTLIFLSNQQLRCVCSLQEHRRASYG